MQLTIFDYLPNQERPVDICEKLFKTGRRARMVAGRVRQLPSEVLERIQATPISVEPEQIDSTPAPVCSEQTPEVSQLQPFAEHEWACWYCDDKQTMKLNSIDADEAKFVCSKNKKHLLTFTFSGMSWNYPKGGQSGPLPDKLMNYFDGEFSEQEKALILLAFDLRGEKTGNIEDEQYRKQVFLETGKVVNLHAERSKAMHLDALSRAEKMKATKAKKTESTPLSSPSVNSAPEPAAKVILGKPLGRSHPGLGINKPVCFYCKGQEELEYAGLFPNAIKSMNHHIWRCKKQPRHQLVCAEKGDWWYQWCGGVGYGVTYGVPELWMWKDIFQAATGQEPELTPEPESGLVKYAPPKSESAQPCHHCGEEMNLKSWDILTFKLQPILKFECQNDHWLNFYPPPMENEEDKNHVSDRFGCVTVFHTGSGRTLKTIWTTSAPWMREVWEKIRAEEKGLTNVPALEVEAAELREKIAGVQFIRNQQKLAAELKEQRENASKEIQIVMGRGHSRLNDEAAAHWGSIFDSLSAKISLIEEDIPSIIPATWRWESRLAEIEKELEGGQS